MPVVFHIGAEKCASTTIQKMLEINEALLKDNGILVPHGLGRATAPLNHAQLVPASYADNREDDLTQFFYQSTDKSIFKNLVEQKISEIAASAPGNCVVFTSEHFSSRLRATDSIKHLDTLTKPINRGEPRKIVLVIRNQYEWHLSAYNTYIKCGGTSPLEDWLVNSLSVKSACWLDISERWGEVFGEDNIIIMPLRDAAPSSRAEHAFLRCLGLPEDVIGSIRLPKPQNRSSSLATLAKIRELNHMHPWMVNGVIDPDRARLVQLIVDEEFDSGKEAPSPPEQSSATRLDEIKKRIDEAYRSSNDLLVKRYPSLAHVFF